VGKPSSNEIECHPNRHCGKAFIKGMPSKSALGEAFIQVHWRDAIRIGIAGKPSSEECSPNRQCGKAFIRGMPSESALRSKSKKINDATRSNQSWTLFGKK
jgi:hypothetical protein